MSLQQRFWSWSAVMLAVALAFGLGVWKNLRLETDILALLPDDERDAGASAALRSYSDGISRKALFLVGAADAEQARVAAARFAGTLRESGVFERVRMEIEAADIDVDAVYQLYRYNLLSPRLRELLRAGEGEKIYADALRSIYSPGAVPRPLPVAQDPLNLFGDFLAQSHSSIGNAHLQNGVLVVNDAQLTYVLIGVQMAQSPFATAAQERLMPVIETAMAQARATPGISVLGSGLILHATAATRSATREIGRVGTLSMIGVVLMVLLTFRSLRPLLLSALVLGSGALAAVVVCHYLFGRIHLITLVFGTGLIGVAIDYSNHFLADQFRNPANWTPAQALQQVGPGIAMGMSCAALGYLGLSLAPLPGLQQMAVFSAVGLVTACASVLFWYPLLARPARRVDPPLLLRASLRIDAGLGRLRALRGSGLLLVALLALGALGLWRLHFAEDLHTLQSSPKPLLRDEQSVRNLLRSTPDSQLYLVRGKSPAEVLEIEERLGAALSPLIDSGAITGYQALSNALPSPQRQRENHQLIETLIATPQSLAPRLLAQLGFADDVIDRHRNGIGEAATATLQLSEWLQSPASEPYRHLWLGALDGGYASIVNLVGATDFAVLRAVDVPGAKYIDKVADISGVLTRYREIAALLIAGTYSLIGLLLAWRYGAGTALRLLAVPVGAALLTLSLFGLLGLTASLFNVLALFLVLGLGVDYAVFLREGRDARGATLLALSLSTLGTVLSYGLLAFSATPFIRSLGLTLLVGISLTYVFALISQRPQTPNP